MASSVVLPPLIAAQLNHLLVHSPFPVKSFQALILLFHIQPLCQVEKLWSARDDIYNVNAPMAAPDVIFGPDYDSFSPFLMEPDSRGNNKLVMSSLVDWNYRESFRLLNLILGLREQYVAYQRKRVQEAEDERIKFEISTISHREGIEMMVTGVQEPEEIKFGVPLLAVNINEMVPGCPWKLQQKIQLQISSFLHGLAECVWQNTFPIWKILLGNGSVAIYCHLLKVFCRRSTFLATSGVFTFLVHISLPVQFPRQQPSIMLQSTQHFNSQGSPIKSTLVPDYPWSPRWEASQMAERIFEYLVEECLNFKKYCSEMQHY